jgi:protein CpxP
MNTKVNQHTTLSMALLMAAALILPLGLTSGLAIAGDKHQEDRVEVRIKEMHDKLKITAAQEEQWAKVEQTMREDAKVMDELTQTRADHAKDMTAIDDLKSYGEITAAHADGIKKLTPVFAALYDTLSDAQKKDADALFRHGAHEHGGHKHGHKAPADKS